MYPWDESSHTLMVVVVGEGVVVVGGDSHD